MPGRRLLRGLAAVERGILSGLMAGIAVTTFAQVVSRYAFGLPIQWSEEVARFFLVWVTFIGMGTLLRVQSGHPLVDTLAQSVPALARAVLELASRAFVLICCLAIVWGGFRIAVLQWQQTSPSLELSMGMVYLGIPIGGLLGVLWNLWPARARPVDDVA